MKRFLILTISLMFLTLGQSAYAFEEVTVQDAPAKTEVTQKAPDESNKVLEANITFDWVDISQVERDKQVQKYKEIVFDQDINKLYLTKDEFKTKFSKFFHDKEFKLHYMLTNNGVAEDDTAKYCAFYYKKNTLVMYAIQYKNNPHNAYYYTAFGKLYYVDITSDAYPDYPYYSMQYDRKGKFKSAIYFISHDMQYMYGPNKEFQGLWYKDKMYDINGKQTLTRSNW